VGGVRSDGELVAASLNGDRAAFGLLIDRHRPRVTALVRRMLTSREEAEDVVQEAVLQAFLGLERLREPASFGSWLCAIAVNVARMRLRSSREPAGLGGAPVPPDQLELVSSDPLPEQVVEELESLAALHEALEPLPAHEREAVLMYYVDGLTAEEIAALLDERPGTVRVRLHRARGRLRRRLSPMRKELEPMIEVMLDDVVVRVVSEDADAEVPRLANERVRVVLLREKEGDRILPIWVGPAEGDALALHLGGDSMPRPLTADLMARLVEASGGRVERVTVNSLRDDTFYATVTVVADGRSSEIDSRPSDAFNLAARVGAPIFVEPAVMEKSGIAGEDVGERLDGLEREWLKGEGEPEPSSAWRTLSPALVKALYPKPGRK
jgi:RNA polymerase sigma factor (sigma-70 family)